MRQVFLILLIYLSQKNVSTINAMSFSTVSVGEIEFVLKDNPEKSIDGKSENNQVLLKKWNSNNNFSFLSNPNPVAATRTISGVVLDRTFMQPIAGASISVFNSFKELVITEKTDSNGAFHFQLVENDDYYLEYTHECFNIRFRKLEYVNYHLPDFVKLYLDPVTEMERKPIQKEQLDLSKIPHHKVDMNLVLSVPNVNFDLDDTKLSLEAKKVIDQVADILYLNPNLEIEIAVHTSMGALEDYNLNLTDKRALSRYQYLGLKDLDINRVSYKGYGSFEPIFFDYTALDLREKDPNRRVEFRIVNR